MSPLDTQLRSTVPAELPALDHHRLQRRGRRRRVATRAATASAGTAVLAMVALLAPSGTGSTAIDPVAPASPAPTTPATSAPATSAPVPSTDRLRQAMADATPADLDVVRVRHLRAVSSVVRAGRDVDEWARIRVVDQRAEDGGVTMSAARAELRDGVALDGLRDVLADLAAEPDRLAEDPADRWHWSGPAEPTSGGFEGDRQLDDAEALARDGDTLGAAQRLGDAMLSLSAGPEGAHWHEILDVLDRLDADAVVRDVDLLGRDVTGFVFTADAERLELLFDAATGRPVGIDVLADTGETDDGTPLFRREVVVALFGDDRP
jgi:hypothetical protein